MARLVSIATGNFTAAATWGTVDATSYLNAENVTETLLTTLYSDTRSSAFTPGAITISHIGVKLCERIGTTGTMSVHLELDADNTEVAGTEVIINTADLPSALEADLNGGWIFFKLSAPVLLLAATAYQVAAKTSSATQVDLWKDATVDNISRALVTTTTQTPVAGDDLIVAGEKTGAGTSNAFTVTMDETAATDYGAAPTAANSLILPGLAVCHQGTVTYGTTAATNYYLKMSNSIVVYSGGTLNIGTVATPIPRDGSAVLEFDPAADGDYGLIIRNLGTFVAQGLSRTVGKNVVSAKLNTDEAAAQTVLGVDTDTGWLASDEIVISSTTQSNQNELRVLSVNASATELTITAGLTNAHSGTSPTQAEVILLTRNVKIRSATSTLMTFVDVKTTATVDIDWVEFLYLGATTTGSRGVEIETTTGDCNIQFSSFHDFDYHGIYITGAAVNNITFNNNCCYNLNTTDSVSPSAGFGVITATSGTAIVISGNYFFSLFGAVASGTYGGVNINDLGITFTNNVMVAVQTCELDEAASITGTFSGNIIHGGSTLLINDNISGGTISNTTIWRGDGISFGDGSTVAVVSNLTFDTVSLFGNTSPSIDLDRTSGQYRNLVFKNVVSNGDTTFATTSGVSFGNVVFGDVFFLNSDFSTVSGIKTAHTNDLIVVASADSPFKASFVNTKMGGTNEVASQTLLDDDVFEDKPIQKVSSMKHNQTAGTHKSWFKYGTITTDTTAGLFRTASPSERLTPNNASNKLESGSFKVNVNSGQTCTPSVYVRESVV